MELSWKKILIALMVVLVCIAGYFYKTNTLTAKTGGDYNRLRDLSSAYAATEEIKTAQEKLSKNPPPVQLIRQGVVSKKSVCLTFDGMTDSATTDKLLDLLTKYKAKGTFFVEGANAVANPKTVTAIVQAGQKVGNYTYVGLAQLEKAPSQKILAELCRTQKVLKITTDFTPKAFKSPKTVYTPQLLQAAAAAGLSYGVQTGVLMQPANLKTQEAANTFVHSLKPGSILSLELGIPGEIQPEKGKTNERPAIDKQPGLEAIPAPVQGENVAVVLERVLIALQQQKYETEFVENFAQQKLLAVKAATEKDLWQRAREFVVAQFTMSTAYAAAPAQEEKMLYTVEPVVPFTFTGLAKENSVRRVLQTLKDNKARGTFFVTEQEIKQHGSLVGEIKAAGNELGIAIRPKASEGYEQIKKSIISTQNLLSNNYGVDTRLIKQFSGAIKDETKQAIGDLGCRLIGQTVNVVQTRHQNATTSAEVMKDIIGAKVYSLGRGWIVQIRMDYYHKESLAADMVSALKKEKIDNIAYRSYYDTPETNARNDSSYRIDTISSVLTNKKDMWTYPVPSERILPSMEPASVLKDASEKEFQQELAKRYIGFKWVNEDDRMLGFSTTEANKADKTGVIHTNDPVVFFTFDDWGTDASVNKLLYVFRKHGVKGNFFVLTHNVQNNPNLLRAIAMEGHDICSHSNSHKPMAIRKDGSSKQYPTQSPEEMLLDGKECYAKLLSITGDIDYKGKPVLTKYYRAPTLAISKQGVKALFTNGYEYIVAGVASTEDYSAPDLKTMLNRLTDAIYKNGKVRKGSALVMHMSDTSLYTAIALDMLLTANEKRSAEDPAKFMVGKLSDYLTPDYDQSKPFKYR